MNCQADIENLAKEKLEDALILAKHGKWGNAYYLAGYCLELTIKSKVCEHLGVPDLFDFENNGRIHMKGINQGLLKVHGYNQLFFLTGRYMKFVDANDNDMQFKKHWSIVSKWSPESRYLTTITQKDYELFVSSLNEITQWIQKNW